MAFFFSYYFREIVNGFEFYWNKCYRFDEYR